jgi:AbrB family looped-hinge helix DNA binding protein
MHTVVCDEGQITIPRDLLDRLGVRPGDELELSEEKGRLIIVKALPSDPVSSVYGSLGKSLDTNKIIDELRGPGPS